MRLAGGLTFEAVPLLYREMEKRLPSAGPVTTIDLAGVTTADSAGLALLLEWQSRQRQRGRATHHARTPRTTCCAWPDCAKRSIC